MIDYSAATCFLSTPATILIGATTLHAKEDSVWAVDPVLAEIMSSRLGNVGFALEDALVKYTFTPMSIWTGMSILVPTVFRTGVLGTRLASGTNQIVQVWATDGDLYKAYNMHVTKPPQLLLGADTDLFGAVEMSGIVAHGKSLSEASSWYDEPLASQADPSTALDLTNYLRCRWTGKFETPTGVGGAYESPTGWSEFEPDTHFTVAFASALVPCKAQGLTRDWKLETPAVSVKCVPLGPSAANIHAIRGLSAAAQGGRLVAKHGRLTLSSAVSSKSIQIDHVYLNTQTDVFGKALRNGEISFNSVPKIAAAGGPETLVTLSA